MKIAVYCGSSMGNDCAFKAGAEALGSAIGHGGHTLVYGGAAGGLMGAVADAALSSGAEVIGVLPNVPLIQERRHPHLTQYVETANISERKNQMIDLADAYIALPGGPGTLDEITDIITLARLRMNMKPCIFFDIHGFYAPIRALFEKMSASAFVGANDFDTVLISSDLDEIMRFASGQK